MLLHNTAVTPHSSQMLHQHSSYSSQVQLQHSSCSLQMLLQHSSYSSQMLLQYSSYSSQMLLPPEPPFSSHIYYRTTCISASYSQMLLLYLSWDFTASLYCIFFTANISQLPRSLTILLDTVFLSGSSPLDQRALSLSPANLAH